MMKVSSLMTEPLLRNFDGYLVTLTKAFHLFSKQNCRQEFCRKVTTTFYSVTAPSHSLPKAILPPTFHLGCPSLTTRMPAGTIPKLAPAAAG